MDCEFRDEALHGRGKDYANQKPKTYWTDCYERDMWLLQNVHTTMDFSYFAIGMRGSDCWRDEEGFDDYPVPVTVFHSIMSVEGYAVLSTGASVDIMEFFGCQGGTFNFAVRRKLKTGPIVDLVLGFDLSKREEREKLMHYVATQKPKGISMGPPCTHFGSLSNINRRYPSFKARYVVSEKLANFAIDVALLQLECGRDFIAENPQASKLWHLPKRQRVINLPRIVKIVYDQCMSGLTISDIDLYGEPILVRKATMFVASRWCLIKLLDRCCQHDRTKVPHGTFQGNRKGQPVIRMAQEWPAIVRRQHPCEIWNGD